MIGKKFEILPPENYVELLEKRCVQLENAIKFLEESVKKAPAGAIRIAGKGKNTQFYHIGENTPKTGRYVTKNEFSLAKKIIQADYDKIQIEALNEELSALQKLMAFSQKGKAAKSLSKVNEYRKAIATPATLSDEEYAVQWKNMSFRKKSFSSKSADFATSSGQRVRSKSEIIIAQTLEQSEIPFRYEFPIVLELGDCEFKEFFPDFYCLNLRTRKEFIWEHFGMMDDPQYAANAVGKLKIYGENGWLPGKNMIISMETRENPVSVKCIKAIIEQILK